MWIPVQSSLWMEIGLFLWMVLRVTLENGATSSPWGWCRELSMWMLLLTLVYMMSFSAFCFSVILVFSGNGGLFWVFFCTHFIWLPQHLQLVVPEHNPTWEKLIRIVINYEMGSADSSEWPMKRKHHYIIWILSSAWFKSVKFAFVLCVTGWASGSWGLWNIDCLVLKVFFNLFTLQLSRFCIVPA